MPFTPPHRHRDHAQREGSAHAGTGILERHLAACVNIVPGVESHYRWQGKLEKAEEVVMVIKSSAEQFEALARLRAPAPFL